MYSSLSPKELHHRRRQLRRERRAYAFKICWQTLLLLSICGGVLWAIGRPNWIIRQPQQIQIQGNHALTEKAVREMLAIQYPVSLLEVEPQAIHSRLLEHGSILAATVHRDLIPPRIIVRVRDRLPVAVVDPISAKAPAGMIDEMGQWLPTSSYNLPTHQIPKLKVLLSSDNTCPNWFDLYRAIYQSPIKIEEVDCRNSLNLILKSEIGSLRLGGFDRTKIYKQLQEAYKLRNWQQYYDPTTVLYLDLENPSSPKIQSTTLKSSDPIDSSKLLPNGR
jgi:cell division protein FtsQ